MADRQNLVEGWIGLKRTERLALVALFALGLALGWLDAATSSFGG